MIEANLGGKQNIAPQVDQVEHADIEFSDDGEAQWEKLYTEGPSDQ